MNDTVLVLNQNYEPLNVCALPRAFRLLVTNKAEVVEYDHRVVRTPKSELLAPSVVRLRHLVHRRRHLGIRPSRQAVFLRDNWVCQYCGAKTKDLTLDHVVPRHRGGTHTWTNLVAACKACNLKKGGQTPAEARMRLLRPPAEPRNELVMRFGPYLSSQRHEAWRAYLGWEPR
jgi:5-methylcytosine-specific restriction endonuclease McrA